MEFKIELPKNSITPEEIKNRNRALFKEDLDRNGNLAKIFVFTKMNEPVSNDDLKKILYQYYKYEVDINIIKRTTKRLNELGIIQGITSGELMTLPHNEYSEIQKKAYNKFFQYLDHIPKQFKHNYNKLAYYWISDEESEKYLEWCCKILGFKMTKLK